MNPETLARWLVASGEFVDRSGPYLRLEDEYDVWVLEQGNNPCSPHDLAKAILEFLNQT